jgi:anti-sigma B factor antagonist
MAIQTTEYKRCAVLKMNGRIDSVTSDELKNALIALNEKGVFRIIFNMEDVSFVSSRGFWVMIEAQKNCKRYNRGELVLANLPDKIKSSLDLVGLNQYFSFSDDIVSAVGNF